MSYELLDLIADSYIPILLIFLLFGILISFFVDKPAKRLALMGLCQAIFLVVCCYIMMFIDNNIGIWPALGMDYSTHTALSLSLCLSLCIIFKSARLAIGVSFLVYVALMIYQKYHTVADIFTTAVVVSMCSYFFYRCILNTKT